jgi:hypothetical protein
VSLFDPDTFEQTLRQGREHLRRFLEDVHEEAAPRPTDAVTYRWPLSPGLEVEVRFLGGEPTPAALARLQEYLALAKAALETPRPSAEPE